MLPPCHVLIDSCAVNRFALINVDPVAALAGSEFVLATTPDLATEYRQAIDHLYVPPYVRGLAAQLLDAGVLLDDADPPPSGDARRPIPRHRTDSHLVALAQSAIVITDDAKRWRRCADACPGLLPWPRVAAHLAADGTLLDLLRSTAAFLPAPER